MRVYTALTSLMLCAALCSMGSRASAQLTTFNDEAAFVAATSLSSFESFEGLAPRLRSAAPLTLTDFTVTPDAATLGVTDGANSPEPTFGTAASDGTHALFVYNPNVPTGTLTFTLNGPATAFGFDLLDAGETAGKVTIRTNAGESLSEVTLAQYPPLLGNGSVEFLGFTQKTAFTQVFVTVTGVDEAYGIDKVRVKNAAPEPSSMGLIALVAFGGLMPRLFARRANPRSRDNKE